MLNGFLERTVLKERIRVEKYEISPLRLPQRQVVRGTKAQIDVALKQADLRKILLNHLGGPIGRIIVYNEDLYPQIARFANNRIEAFTENLSRVKGDDND